MNPSSTDAYKWITRQWIQSIILFNTTKHQWLQNEIKKYKCKIRKSTKPQYERTYIEYITLIYITIFILIIWGSLTCATDEDVSQQTSWILRR